MCCPLKIYSQSHQRTNWKFRGPTLAWNPSETAETADTSGKELVVYTQFSDKKIVHLVPEKAA